MFFDKHALPWIILSVFLSVVASCFYVIVLWLPTWQRLCYSALGLMSFLCCLFCTALQLVKMLPNWMRKRLQSKLDNGHPWIGLLACWLVLLHTNFKAVRYFSVHLLTFYSFWILIGFGISFLYIHHLQVLKKEAKGSPKKDLAGAVIDVGYGLSKLVHESVHYFFYIFLFFHVYAFFIYGRFW